MYVHIIRGPDGPDIGKGQGDYCDMSENKKVMLLDGGIGQELVKRYGKPATKYWASTTLIEKPEILSDVHNEYFDCGATVATTNTYVLLFLLLLLLLLLWFYVPNVNTIN